MNDQLVVSEEDCKPQPFSLVFDDAVPLNEGSLAHALPRIADECMIFSYIKN